MSKVCMTKRLSLNQRDDVLKKTKKIVFDRLVFIYKDKHVFKKTRGKKQPPSQIVASECIFFFSAAESVQHHYTILRIGI